MEFRDYLELLRRRGLIVLLALCLSLAGAYYVTGRLTPTYEAQTTVFVGGVGSSGKSPDLPSVESGSTLQSLARSYAEFAASGSVRREAERRLGSPISSSDVKASAVGETQILKISSTARDGRRAAAQANAVARSLAAAIARQPGRRQARLSVVDAAVAPADAQSPKLALNLAVAGLLGLLLGYAAAFGAERLDRRVRHDREPDSETPLPVLGRVPTLPRGSRRDDAAGRQENPRVAEPYRRLATTIEHVCRRSGVKSFVITSAARGEGKTTVAAQLAWTLAEEGNRVALVEGDFRRPDLNRLFHLEGAEGIAEPLLAGERPAGLGARANLEMFLAGRPDVRDARRLVGSRQLGRFLSGLRQDFDLVLIDAPPVLALADAGLLAQQADGALLVMREGQTSLDEFAAAQAALGDLDVELVGSVLNAAPDQGGGYGYYTAAHEGRLGRLRAPRLRGHDSPSRGGGGGGGLHRLASLRWPAGLGPRLRRLMPGRLAFPRRIKLALGASLLVVLLTLGAAALALASGTRTLSHGLAALEAGRIDRAEQLCRAAHGRLRIAHAVLGPLAAVAGWAGPPGRNLDAAGRLSGGGRELASGGVAAASGARVASRGFTRATLPMLQDAAAHFENAGRRLDGRSRRFTFGGLAGSERKLERRTLSLVERSRAVAALAALTGSPARYLLVVQNGAELRATGGLIGAFGVVDTRRGDLRLTRLASDRALPRSLRRVAVEPEFARRYGRFGADRTWANANMSPDFPTSARVLLGLYARGAGPRLDGVMAIDAVGLSYLLEAMGPTRAGGQTLRGESFVRKALSEAYRRPPAERAKVLIAGARAGWASLGVGDRMLPVSRALANSVEGRHLLAYAAKPKLQRRLAAGGLAGAVTRAPGDYLMVVRQNAGANKLDYYLKSTLRYDVRLRPDGTGDALLRTSLKNAAPRRGLPDYVLGRRLPSDPRGLARSWVSAYSPASAQMVGFAGPEGPTAETGSEQGHAVRSWFQAVAPAHRTRARLRLRLPSVVGKDGRYRLLVERQPTLRPARIVVRVNGRLLFDGELRRDLELSARV